VITAAMIVISLERLHSFINAHKRGADARGDLLSWYWLVKDTAWKTPHDVKTHYPKASILKGGVVIFNIRSNEFRLITRINYKVGIVVVEWVGTHREYDKVNAEQVTWKE
jgi:mRNA interferase HigB